MTANNDTLTDEQQREQDDSALKGDIDDVQVDPNDPSTWDGDRPPEEAVASKDDFEVQRDGDGELIAQWEQLPGSEKWVEVVPARQGDAERYLPESGDPNDMTDRQIVEVLNEFYRSPEWNLNPRNAESELDDIKAFAVDALVMAWFNASGFEYQMGFISDNAEVLQAVEGNIESGS